MQLSDQLDAGGEGEEGVQDASRVLALRVPEAVHQVHLQCLL